MDDDEMAGTDSAGGYPQPEAARRCLLQVPTSQPPPPPRNSKTTDPDLSLLSLLFPATRAFSTVKV
jgi:hypothetical protein